VVAASLAAHHAERAERLAAVLPIVPGMTAAEVTVAPPALQPFLALLDATGGHAGTDGGRAGGDGDVAGAVGGVPGPPAHGLDAVAVLAGHVHCLLAELSAGYRALADRLDRRVGAPLVRVLRAVTADLDDDRHEAEA